MSARVASIRPIPGALKGKVKSLCTRFGVSATAQTLGLGRSVVDGISKGHPMSQDVTNRVWLALEEFERKSVGAARQPPVVRHVEMSPVLEMRGGGLSRLQASEQFQRDVWDRRVQLDPTNSIDWVDVAFGYFMAKGFSAADARNLAVLVANNEFCS